jgi:mono/diheme cytochrome c family protein
MAQSADSLARLLYFRVGLVCLPAFYLGVTAAVGQTGTGDVKKGHDLAVMVCANCHVAAPDQRFEPILKPPASSFQAIAQRKTTTVESVEAFLTSTHKGLDNPKGMPNPLLLDSQVKDVAAYLLSLKQKP